MPKISAGTGSGTSVHCTVQKDLFAKGGRGIQSFAVFGEWEVTVRITSVVQIDMRAFEKLDVEETSTDVYARRYV